MKNFLVCRRTYIATLAISALLALGCSRNMDVSYAIAAVAVGLAASNAYEGAKKETYKG